MTGAAAGSLGDEAARLAAAVQDWLHGLPDPRRTAGEAATPAPGDGAQSGEDSPPECLVCPACQLLRLLRGARPEVYGHLADAAASMSAALRELGADGAPPRSRRGNVEHIDLG